MKICPFCNQSIEDNNLYCPNCNKPLISNLEKSFNRIFNPEFNDINPSFNLDEKNGYYSGPILKDENLEQEIQKIDEILKRNEILGDQIPGSLLLKKSSLYYKKRDLENALRNLKLALKNFEDEDDLFNSAICHNEIGLIQEDLGFFDQAIYHFNRSLEFLKESKDNQKVIKVLNNLGNIYYLIKDLEHSYKFYQEALTLAKQENLIHEEIKTSSNLVEVLFLLKDFDRIKRILTRNLEFFRQNEDVFGIITTKVKYGKYYFFLGGDYDLANEELKTALQLIERISTNLSVYMRSRLEWECYLYLGKINLLWNNLEFTENSFIKSLEAVRIFEIGENINEGEILENLAYFYELKGEIEKSIDYYNLSFEIYHKFGDSKKCAQIKVSIGEIFLDFKKDKSTAILFFEDALSLYEDLQYFKKIAEIHDKLGDIYVSDKLSKMALENYKKARDYYSELHDDENLSLVEEKIRTLRNI